MEGDPVFRTGVINPTVEDGNYVADEWDKLAVKLNAVGNGPVFSATAWRKVTVYIF